MGCIGALRPRGDEHFIAKTHGSRYVDFPRLPAFPRASDADCRTFISRLSFHETDLHEYLQSKGIKSTVLVGYQPQVSPVKPTTPALSQD